MEPGEILYIIGQIIGFVAVMLAIVQYQMRKGRSVLILQTLVCATLVIHYGMIEAYSAMALNLVGVFRNLVYCNRRIFRHAAWPYIFCGIMLVAGVLSWVNSWSVLIVLGLVINTYFLSLPNPQALRASILVTSPMALIYNVAVFSPAGILFEAMSIVSAAVGLLRYRKRDGQEKNA